ncbi:cupin domain-containing protein [Acidithiobacillus sp. AMEEHan]|uniref:cupin domain-containing protein n=1 Tax=Acidithiobacillus sp. AMEEHan TaxID=2994951 RepID=UPI0027E50EB1|nr:cupin domain-containing protein [Acidithiobacillus sp. AMEEHan]
MKIDEDIGKRLQLVRKIYGLTQRELSRRAGVTNGAISLIEQGRVSPSISSLKKILDAIPMSISDFFTIDLVASDSIFFSAQEMPDISLDKKIMMCLLGGSTKGRAIQILHEYYQPGSDTGETMLRHHGEEGGIVIKGSIEITVGDKKKVLNAGDGYYFSSQIPHRFNNIGEEVCEIISANSPPTF